MAATNSEERIESFIDLPSVKREGSEFISLLTQIFDQYQKINSTKITLQGAQSTSSVASETKKLKTDVDALTAAQDKLNKSQTEQAQKLAVVKEQQLQANKANKDAARETLGLTDAYAKLSKQYDESSRAAKNLAVTADQVREKFGATSPQFLKASQDAEKAANSANELGNRLKAIDSSVGQFQRNVGNYTGAVSILEKSLNDVRTSIDQFNKSGNQNVEVLDKLTREEQLLEQILGQNVGGFASLTQEIRNNERALQTMQEEGLKNTEVFQQLRTDTANAKRELNEFQKSQQLLSSEAPALAALTSVAKGLGAAYAVSAGAAALFADGDEKVEKELAKLVAVMTLLQGLTEINTALKEKDAIATALQTAATKVSTFAQKIWQATVLSSTVTTVAFRTVLIGLTGGLLLLLPLIALGASNLNKYKSAEQDAALKAKELNEVNLKANETFADQSVKLQSLKARFQETNASFLTKKEVTAELNKEFGEYGVNLKNTADTEKFLTDKAPAFLQMLDLKAKATAALALATDEYKKILNAQTKSETEYVSNTQVFFQALKSNITGLFKSSTSNIIDATSKLVDKAEEARKKEIDESQKTYDILLKMATGFSDQADKIAGKNGFIIPDKIDTKALERALQAAHDLIVANLEQFAQFFRSAADDEKQSYDNRLSSLALFYQQQQKLIEEDLRFQLSKKGITAKEKEVAEVQAQTKFQSLQKQFAGERVALAQAEADKELKIAEAAKAKQIQLAKDQAQAREDLRKDELQMIANGSAGVDTVYATEYAQQEKALVDSYNRKGIDQETYQRESLKLQYDFQVKQLQNDINAAKRSLQVSGITGDEKLALQNKIAELELQLAKATGKQIEDIESSNVDKLKKSIETVGALASDLGGIISNIGGISINKENAALDEQLRLLDEKKQKEIEVADQTIQNEQEKAAAITTINAKADAQKAVLDARKRQLQERQARFDKAANIANIATTTGLAVVTTLADKTIVPGFLRIPLAIAVGALGLAQLINAIATPIPVYGEGTIDHTGGPAWVGDAGKKEVAVTPDGNMHITPDKPTLVNLPRHTKVFPDADEYLKVSYKMLLPKVPAYESSLMDQYNYLENMTTELKKELRSVKATIANKRENHYHVTPYGLLAQQRDLNNQIDYLNENLHF